MPRLSFTNVYKCFSLFHSQNVILHSIADRSDSRCLRSPVAPSWTALVISHSLFFLSFASLLFRAIFIPDTPSKTFFFLTYGVAAPKWQKNPKGIQRGKEKQNEKNTFKHLLTHSKWIMTVSLCKRIVWQNYTRADKFFNIHFNNDWNGIILLYGFIGFEAMLRRVFISCTGHFDVHM